MANFAGMSTAVSRWKMLEKYIVNPAVMIQATDVQKYMSSILFKPPSNMHCSAHSGYIKHLSKSLYLNPLQSSLGLTLQKRAAHTSFLSSSEIFKFFASSFDLNNNYILSINISFNLHIVLSPIVAIH